MTKPQLNESSLPQQHLASLLFVDDESNILSSLKRLFRPLGYEIFTAQNGHEGLTIMERNSIDLVISDMRMPEMDGAVFLEQVASRWPDTARILLTGYADLSSTIKAVNSGQIYRYISKPWEDNDIVLSIKRALEQRNLRVERDRLAILTGNQNKQLKTLNNTLEDKVKARTGELQQTVSFLELAYQSLDENYQTSVEVFSNLIETREHHTSHARHAAELAQQLGQMLGNMAKTDMQNLRNAALLRNIGKIGLSDSLLNKAVNNMNDEEYKLYSRHPIIGEGVLMAIEPLYDVSRLIRQQHEQMDGKGYPDNLTGEAIPLAARILVVVGDYFDLQFGRLVAEKLDEREALGYLNKHRDSRYDSEVVIALNSLLGEHKVIKPDQNTELCVKSNGLRSGMVLSRDLFISKNVLLLSKGHALNDSIITRIQNLEDSVDSDLDIYIQTKREVPCTD